MKKLAAPLGVRDKGNWSWLSLLDQSAPGVTMAALDSFAVTITLSYNMKATRERDKVLVPRTFRYIHSSSACVQRSKSYCGVNVLRALHLQKIAAFRNIGTI